MRTRALGRAMIAMLLFAPSIFAAPAKGAKPKSHATSRPEATTRETKPANAKPLTAEQLGLDNISLASIKNPQAVAASPAQAAPAEAPASPAKPVPAAAPPPKAAPAPKVEAPLVERDRDRVLAPAAAPLRRLTILLNPLPIAAGRYGGDVDLVFAHHHALVASGWLQTFTPATLRMVMPSAVDVRAGAAARPGGELGYRFFSGDRGANGFFMGASGVVVPLALPRLTDSFRTEVVSFDAYGGAIDFGGQHVTRSGFTIGAGAGVMALAWTAPHSAPLPAGAPRIDVPLPHVLPRVLLSAGWSF